MFTDMADSSQLGTRQRIEGKAAKLIPTISSSPATPKPASGDSGTARDTNNQEAERRVREDAERQRGDREKPWRRVTGGFGKPWRECDRRVQAADGGELTGRATEAMEARDRATVRQTRTELLRLRGGWWKQRAELLWLRTGLLTQRGVWQSVKRA